jgi:hypothetical protein
MLTSGKQLTVSWVLLQELWFKVLKIKKNKKNNEVLNFFI